MTQLPRFPTLLRKMWSGAEVQRWIDEHIAPLFAPSAEPAVEWLWYGRDDQDNEHISLGRWAKHPCQTRYKPAEVQPTEHDHPVPTSPVHEQFHLMRNASPDGSCKYALIRLDKIHETGHTMDDFDEGDDFYHLPKEYVENARAGEPEECFVLKLKDVHSPAALEAYAASVETTNPKFGAEVRELARRAGKHHPNPKAPD